VHLELLVRVDSEAYIEPDILPIFLAPGTIVAEFIGDTEIEGMSIIG